MICADFLAGANLDNGDPETLLFSMTRFFTFLPGEQRQGILWRLERKGIMTSMPPDPPRIRLDPLSYQNLKAAGPAPRWLAVPSMRFNVMLGSSPQTVS